MQTEDIEKSNNRFYHQNDIIYKAPKVNKKKQKANKLTKKWYFFNKSQISSVKYLPCILFKGLLEEGIVCANHVTDY